MKIEHWTDNLTVQKIVLFRSSQSTAIYTKRIALEMIEGFMKTEQTTDGR